MMSIPLFDSRTLPTLFKAGFALCLSLVIFPLADPVFTPAMAGEISLAIGILSEVMLGAAIGLIVRTIFAGVQLAGQLAGYQMGMAIANVLDPATSNQVPLLSQVYHIFAMLIFVSINAHFWFFNALVESFRLVPPLGFQFNGPFLEILIHFSGQIFVTGIKIGAPIITVLLLTSVSFGLIARTVPQMNIFIVAMPLKIAVGMLFIALSLPFLTSYLNHLFSDAGIQMLELLATQK
jgi:flagellar biosynthetic protein FliR